jgi:hypothetical protein
MANARAKIARDDAFWKNKKVVLVLNFADEAAYAEAVRMTGDRDPGKKRKECIRAALKIQNFLACPVDNLVAIIANQGGYQLNGTFTLPQDVRCHLLTFRDAGAIRIE